MAHEVPSHSSPGVLCFLAFVHVARMFSLASTFGFALLAMVQDNPEWLIASGISLFLWTVLALIHLTEAPRIRCAVCTAPLFEKTACAKHRGASKTLGGYRLNTALQVLGTTHYDCHHCGEQVHCGLGGHAASGEESPPEEVPLRKTSSEIIRSTDRF